MLITRLIYIQWKFTTPEQLAFTIKMLLIKILLFFNHWIIHSLQSNQHFQAIEFMDWLVLEKRYIFHVNLS